MAEAFVWADRCVLMRAGQQPPSGYSAMPSVEAVARLARMARAPGVMANVYKLWLVMAAGSSSARALAPKPADYARALRWALGQLGERGALALCRSEPARAGELRELFDIARPYLPEPPRTDDPHWIQFDLHDQTGEPIAGAPYAIRRGEDVIAQGALDRFGTVYLETIDPGAYRFGIPSAEAEPIEGDFLVLELVDDQGEPVAGARYRVTDGASNVHDGVLDASGRALLEGIEPGSCEVTFLDWRDDARAAQ